MSHGNKFSLIKPTLQTPFHIDFDWWKQHDTNWRVHLRSFLCEEHQEKFAEISDDNTMIIDWIDPITAEVKPIDGLQHTLMTHCAKQPEFLTRNTTLVDAVFRVFIANGNSALSPEELAEMVGKPATTIMRTLSGPKVYKGLRPIQHF